MREGGVLQQGMRIAIFSLTCFLFLCPEPSFAFGKNVAVIKSQDIPIYRQALKGFNKIYTGRIDEFDLDANPDAVAQLKEGTKKKDWDLILAVGLLAARVSREAFPDTPIIFCMIFGPERFSLSGPNITGVSLDLPPSIVLPRIKSLFLDSDRIGILYDPKNTKNTVEAARKTAQAIGVTLVTEAVTSNKAIPQAFQNLLGKVDLLWMLPDSTVVTPESIGFLLLSALRHKLPVVTFSDGLVGKGAVAAISPDYGDMGEEAGRLVNQIFEGRDFTDIPILNPKKINVTINLKTATKIGTRLNLRTLKTVDKIYE